MENRRYSAPEYRANREAVTSYILLSSREVADNSSTKSAELKEKTDGSKGEVKREVKLLLRRSEVMANGIKEEADETDLAGFLDYLDDRAKVMNGAISVAQSNLVLAGMIQRYGEGIQANMIVNGLLTDEAKQELQGLRVDFSDTGE